MLRVILELFNNHIPLAAVAEGKCPEVMVEVELLISCCRVRVAIDLHELILHLVGEQGELAWLLWNANGAKDAAS